MGNDPLRTGYVTSNHLVIPGLFYMLFFIHCHRTHFLALLTYPNHMEDNIRRFIYTQTQHIIVIIWHRTIREATVMTFYPGGFRSPPRAKQGFQTPG